MTEHLLVGLASVLILGIGAQWLAWRLRLPSILLLLTFGFIAGPVTGFLHVDELLGDLLFPLVSVSVGIILFEGALSLRFIELRQTGRVLRNLLTIGALVTWVLSSAAAYFVLNFDPALAIMLGAILVVTGPTVVGPLLRFVRPTGQSSAILRWEGILIDPIGATLALLVFEAILIGDLQQAAGPTIRGIIATIVVGGVIGVVLARALVLVIERYWMPDYLQTPVTLMAVVGAFTLSNVLQHESGLVATTVMGLVMANQRRVTVRHIIEFKENVGVLLLSALFILLAARLELSDLSGLGVEALLFVAVMMLVVRPVSVLLSTVGSGLSLGDKLFISWMAPRGIVAASVASVFSLRLVEAGYPGAERLVPVVFAVIVVTCAAYGLTALPLARRLKLSQANPQGVLIVGAHEWGRAIAEALQTSGYKTQMVDSNYANVQAARLAGLEAYYGSIISEDAHDEIDIQGIGRLLALTSNDEVNSLASLRYVEFFGRAEVYQLPISGRTHKMGEKVSRELRGRTLFASDATFQRLTELFEQGATIKITKLTEAFDYDAYQAMYGESVLPLFLVDGLTNRLVIFTTDRVPAPQPGQSVISLVLDTVDSGIDARQAAMIQS